MDKTSKIIYESRIKEIEMAKRRFRVALEQKDECKKELDRLIGDAQNIKKLGWEEALKFQQERRSA